MFLSTGYRLIDTAYSYKNEAEIGTSIKRLEKQGKITRKDLFITTKVPTVYLSPSDVKFSVDGSLENLQSAYIDLLLIHSPWGLKNLGGDNMRPVDKNGNFMFEHYDICETWKALEEQVKSGRVRSIGVSNFTPSQMLRIMKTANIRPQNAQFECHAYLQQNELRAFCQSHGISCTSFASLGAPGRPAHHKAQASGDSPPLLEDNVVAEIAAKYNKKSSQILLRFMLQTGMCVIPKSETPSRLEENIDLFDFHIEENDMIRLRGLDRGLRYLPFLHFKNHPEFTKTGEPF